MAVTKRLRFEVLRRDRFRCYYCGARGNETTGAGLVIDHVTPVALGGTDDPSNLVASCGDCNSGKSATPTDAELVADVDREVAAYNRARALALQALEANLQAEADYVSDVWDAWNAAAPSYAQDVAPRGIESFASDWYRRGIPIAVIVKAMRITWDGPAARDQKLRYAAGVVKHLMADAEDRTRALVAGDDVVFNAGYEAGWHDGITFAESQWVKKRNESFPDPDEFGVDVKGVD